MAASDVDIVSQALELLGDDPIGGFDESRSAATGGRFYEDVTNSLLVRYPWKFCRKFVKLSRTNVTPPAQWRYEFQLPGDIGIPGVYALYRSDAQGETPFKAYQIVNNKKLYADVLELWMQYTIRPPESDWPAHFYQLAIYAMAAQLAKPITEDTELLTHWWQVAYGVPSDNLRGGYFAVAAQIDAQQDPPARLEEYTLVQARLGDGLPDFR